MMKNKLYDAFMQMTADADPGRVQAAVRAEIGSESRKARQIPARKVLRIAAACAAVLVLSVTVCAAAVKYLTVQVGEEKWFDLAVHIEESAGEMITLSAEKMEMLQEYIRTQEDILNGVRKGKIFQSWQEAAEWLDCGLLVSEYPADCQWNPITMVANPGTEADGTTVIRCITITGSWNRPDTEENGFLSVTIPLSGTWEQYGMVITYDNAETDEQGRLTVGNTPTSRPTTITEYYTENGICAEIAEVLRENGETETSMHIFHGGILYDWMVDSTPESQADLAKAIADSMGYVK